MKIINMNYYRNTLTEAGQNGTQESLNQCVATLLSMDSDLGMWEIFLNKGLTDNSFLFIIVYKNGEVNKCGGIIFNGKKWEIKTRVF